MGDFIAKYQDGLFVSLVVILMVVCISLITVSRSFKKARRNYQLMMASSGVDNLEQLLIDMQNNIGRAEEQIQSQQEEIQSLQNELNKRKGHLGITRYNAFSERGSDLSFSLAIVDDRSDGVVISAIHSREESFLYAKPLEQGQSKYTLSPEEKEAIAQALKKEVKAGR